MVNHSIRLRVYYEDTDAAGVVYYANYLRYIERCRTEWLRNKNYAQSELMNLDSTGFVVRKINAEYFKPARLDDLLLIDLQLLELSAIKVKMLQKIHILTDKKHDEPKKTNDKAIFQAEVDLVVVSTSDLRSKRMSKEMLNNLKVETIY